MTDTTNRVEELKRAKELLNEVTKLTNDADHQLEDQLYYAAERLKEVIDREPDREQQVSKDIKEGLETAAMYVKKVELLCEGFNDALAFELSHIVSRLNSWKGEA